ncbi:MAG: DegV family EDD domain-containing protein [Clostridiales bacterium]|nr:DegV family EDD domain-containing protein [Clostridiales bacterium]
MQYKIVADSSSNMRCFDGVDFACVPLKIITKEKEYVDTPDLDLAGMVEDLKAYKGTSGTSCPNVFEWTEAFGEADCVFAIAITSNLSGSCNAARQAAEDYMAANPGRKVCVLDSLSAGPELRLIAEKVRKGILAGKAFEEIEADTRAYMQHTHLLFTLRSLNNLARNGRVSPAVAKLAGVLGIVVVGKASDEGTLQQMHKCRGEKRAIDTLYSEMKQHGYAGGRVRIGHNMNEPAAQQLSKIILDEYPDADIEIEMSAGLCMFYAEQGGIMVGYEDAQG